MPQLPSGRHIGVLVSSPEEIAHKIVTSQQEGKLNFIANSMSHICTIDDLAPYVNVIFFREVEGSDHDENAKGAILISTAPEKWIEPYRSGLTLADLDHFSSDWSDEDKAVFQAFLAEDRNQNYFQEGLDSIVAFRNDLTKAFMAQYVSALRKAGLHPDQEEVWSEEESSEWDAYDMLAALRDVVIYTAKHPGIYQAHSNALDRATGMWQMLSGHHSFLRNPVPSGLPVRDVARAWRDAGHLNKLAMDQQEWLRKQLIIECANLWNHAGEALEESCPRAYAIMTLATTSPDGAEWT